VTNTFTGAHCEIPVAKTINGENIDSTVDFTFTLKKDSNTAVYTDGNYKEAMPSDGLTATITGTGSTNFKTLYFKSAGTYLFTLTENALSKDASDRGYTKDTNTYKVVVVVSEKDKALAVTSVTYTSDSGDGDILEKGDVPTFDNKLSLTGSLDLEVKKTVTGRAKEVQEGEFSFEVVDNSTGETVKDSEGNAMVFKTESGGNVKIQIPITQEDIGTKRYIIREVVPADADKDPTISYTASPVIAKVTIGEVTAAENGGTAGVAATSKVTYTASKTDNGVPLMVNEYHATGSLKLEGTKELLYGTEKQAIKAGRFNFVVMEGNTQVATGTTNGDWEDNIDFTEINYVTADIGPHTYTISEVNDGEMFVEYTDKTFTVTVDVEDAGDGKLTASAKKYETEDGEKDYRQHALFVNTCTFIIPTGIRLDVLPYVLILILALGCGALVLRRRKHMRG
jgi:pilin isopeptide linkage protein